MLRTVLSISLRVLLAAAVGAITDATLSAADVVASSSEREVALWIVREGGRVLLDGSTDYIGDPFDFPPALSILWASICMALSPILRSLLHSLS